MSQNPSISVIVPYFNEQDCLRYLLDQLEAQTLPPQEVILVNSGSTDASSDLIDEWIATNRTAVKFKNLNASTKTPGGSKSAGISIAKCDLLAFMDCGLAFPTDWLQKQFDLLTSVNADWVSGVCRTTGTTDVDKAAIAHTYGLENARPVIPSSLVRRSVFDRIGVFKDLRAGYDAEWANASTRECLLRGINPNVVVEYQGVNFAKDLKSVFLKSLRYARPSVGRNDTVVPYVYMLGGLAALVVATFMPMFTPFGLVFYVFARLLIARYKSRGLSYFLDTPRRLLTLVVTGAVMDLGKFCGFIMGAYLRYVRRRTLIV